MPYYPTVGMKKPGETVRANFGQEPFAFDIDRMMQDEKATIQAEIGISKAASSVAETDFIQQLVRQYLAHEGYVESARAFTEETINEARALADDDDPDVPYGTVAEDLDALNRQSEHKSALYSCNANVE